MEEKKPSKFDKFFAGKGFYIVLVLCVAVIGISAWSIIGDSPLKRSARTDIALEKPTPAVTEKENGMEPDVNNDGIKDVIEEIDPELQDVATWESGNEFAEPASWVWPVQGEVERGYSVDALAYDVTMADWRTHDGVDVAAEAGALVRAAADGTVESIEQDDLYGTTVTIAHGGGIKTVYSNLAETPTVKVGDEVSAGDVIGSVGETAICEIGEPAHVHFAMSKDGRSLDPAEYLPK